MPIVGGQEDIFMNRMPAGHRLRAEAERVELEVFAPPLYSSLTVSSMNH